MVKVIYVCPNCNDPKYSPVIYSPSEHKPVCGDCGTAFSEFIEYNGSNMVKNIS